MTWGAASGIVIILGVISAYLGVRLLFRTGWFLSWVRGCFGLVLLVISVTAVFIVLDLSSYEQLLAEKSLATLSFQKIEEQHYELTLMYVEEGIEESYDLRGDQWQVDARVIRWLGMFSAMGAKPAYRLDRLSGRYYSLEDERRKERTVHQLKYSDYGLDTWAWLQAHRGWVSWVDAVYGSATYLPMGDGALYQLSLTHNGLTAKPLNKVAEDAVQHWQ